MDIWIVDYHKIDAWIVWMITSTDIWVIAYKWNLTTHQGKKSKIFQGATQD